MADVRICEKCSQTIDVKSESFSVCEGDCACLFHASCVGLTEDDLCSIASRLNLIWMCDKCMHKFRSMSDGTRADSPTDSPKTKSLDDEVRELKNSVAGILETLSKITPTAVTNNRAPLHSTPVSMNMPFEEMQTSEGNVNNAESYQQSLYTNDGDNFSLFLSNVDSSVSEREVHNMVSRTLNAPGPERIDVLKLVSYWSYRRPPDFISFKVTLDKKWKAMAMNPTIWPKQVRIREFIERHNVTWRP